MALSRLEKERLLRERFLEILTKALESLGEEVLRVSGNALAVPTLFDDGEETAVKLTASIPRKDCTGEEYDPYTESTKYKEEQAEKAENKRRKAEEQALNAAKRAERAARKKAEKEGK